MTNINIQDMREEICNILRNGNVISTTIRIATTIVENFTATASQTIFILTNASLRNIRSLTVNSVAKYFLRDYTVNWATKTITLNTGAGVGEVVSVQYDYSSSASEKVYPDLPRDDLTLKSFPRVGIELTSTTTEPFGLGGTTFISDFLLTIIAWMPANKESGIGGGLGGTEDISDLITSIRNVIITNAKSLYTIPYIYPTHPGPITRSINNKIIQQSLDLRGRFKVET